MKRFYILFFTGVILFSVLLYLSVWWLLAGIGVLVLFTSYRFYRQRLLDLETSLVTLENEVDELESQLDRAIRKEQRATMEASQVRNAKQELLTIINHEIRTPMNGVLGMTLLLEDTTLTKEQQEYTATILKSGQSLLGTVNELLVNDLLHFSKFQQHQTPLEPDDFDLREMVEEVLDMFATKASETNLEICCSIADDVPQQVFADHKRIRQVLMNLVENAVKFTQKGEVLVKVSCLKSAQGQLPELCFEVKDTGTGIATDRLSQLFYGTGHRDIRSHDESDNAGLGLIICRKLVDLMQGHIEVKSEPGYGSTFSFTIPVSFGKKLMSGVSQPVFAEKLRGKRILVVDDNATSRGILAEQLKTWGMIVQVADSGENAADLLSHADSYDLVLTDLIMPFTGGIELARIIKTGHSRLPVILMAYRHHAMGRADRELFTSVLPKPLHQYVLRDTLAAEFAKIPGQEKEKVTQTLDMQFAQQYPIRILIAEDNKINQKIAMKILGKLGYEPAIANNGKEALEMVSQKQYDLILMDVQMPEMNGLEATRMIRTCLDEQPIIMAMTANALQGDRDTCIQAGMDDYISKPIDLKELLARFEKWGTVIREKRKVA
jgi:signal transduction histidine kinase/DNA-binding response OmpR family regulator